MPYSQAWLRKITALSDGPVSVALFCGDREPTDGGYKRQTVNFADGSNTAEVRFGPYERGLNRAITGFVLYADGVEIGRESVTPQTPAEAEISTFAVGSLRLGAEG